MARIFDENDQSGLNATRQKKTALTMQRRLKKARGIARAVVAAQQKSSMPGGKPRYIYGSTSARDGRKKSEITLRITQRMNISGPQSELAFRSRTGAVK
jgi:hypothetical protein